MADQDSGSHSQDNLPQQGATLFRPVSDRRLESFENVMLGLLESNIENQKILQNQQLIIQKLVEKSNDQSIAQNGTKEPHSQPKQ